MEYSELIPKGPLFRQVRCIWALRAPAVTGADFEPVFPDGCIELVINLGHPFERWLGGTVEQQDNVLVAGQMLSPSFIRPTGTVEMIGVRLQPWGAPGMFAVPADELVDQILPADVLATPVPTLVAELAEVPDLTTRCLLMERRLVSLLKPQASAPLAVIALAEGTVSSVSRAALDAGVSMRQLERQSQHWTGLLPRKLVRLARFQSALRSLRQSSTRPLAQIAAETGYSDQAHLTREFRRLGGVTPSVFRAAAGRITTAFLSSSLSIRPAVQEFPAR
jgi:AraC-like DNA-binding protein